MSSSSVLAAVKENIEYIAARGWFQPVGEEVVEFPCNPNATGPWGFREAAVLCLIALHHDKPHLLITKRSHNIAFSGDACLPGGSRESQDSSLVETALRETEEEIALDRSRVEVLCTFPQVSTPHRGGTMVTPVVALLQGPTHTLSLTPNPFEVECAYWVPLEAFLDESVDCSIKYSNTSYGGRLVGGREMGWTRVSVKHEDEETGEMHQIWGLTGAMCTTISAVALNKKPANSFLSCGVSQLVRKGNTVTATIRPMALTKEQVKLPNKL